MRAPTASNPRPYWLLGAATSVYLYFFARVLWRIGDEGIFVNGATLVAGGALPYRDFFENVGPGSLYWLGFFFWLFGPSFVVARVVVLCTSVAAALLLLWMTRRLHQGPAQYLPAAIYVVAGLALWPVSNHHWDSNLWALLCLAAVMRWQDDRRDARLVAAGVLAGLTACFLQQKGFLVFVTIAAVVCVDSGEPSWWPRLRRLFLTAAGSSAVIATVALFFYVNGGLNDLMDATMLWPLEHYSGVNRVPYAYGVREWLVALTWKPALEPFLPSVVFRALVTLFLVPYLLVIMLPILCVLSAAVTWKTSVGPAGLVSARTLPYWIGGAALWMSELHRWDIVHLLYGSPVLLILLVAAMASLTQQARMARWSLFGFVVAGVAALGVFQLLIALAARQHIETRRGQVRTFKQDSALAFLHTLPPGSDVFVYPYYSMYYFLADVTNPTPFTILVHNFNTPAQFDRAVRDLDQKQVPWVLWDSRLHGEGLRTWFPTYQPPNEREGVMEQYLDREYERIGMADDFLIFRRRDAASRLPPHHNDLSWPGQADRPVRLASQSARDRERLRH